MSFFKKYKNKFIGLCMSICLAISSAMLCFADGTTQVDSDIASITGALTEFSSTNIIKVIIAALGVAIPLILVWFAFRKIYSWAKGAFFGG